MDDLDEFYSNLHARPLLLNVRADKFNKGVASGCLFIPDGSEDIHFNFFRNKSKNIIANSFLGASPYGFVKVSLGPGGLRSTSTAENDERNEQLPFEYDYLLFSDQKGAVELEEFAAVAFYYNPFIEGVKLDTPGFSADLFASHPQANKTGTKFDLAIEANGHSEQHGYLFGQEALDMITVTMTFHEPKTVREIRSFQYELNTYLTLFLHKPIAPNKVVLYGKPSGRPKRPRYCYLVPHDMKASAPPPVVPEGALVLNDNGKTFLECIVKGVENQQTFHDALNLMGVYWEYRQRSVYLDSQISVLLACLEAIFTLIHTSSKDQLKRERDYDKFIAELDTRTIGSDLVKWLGHRGTRKAYSERKSYSTKARAVAAFAGTTITPEKAETLNKLRNDLMHGRFPTWHSYLSSDFEFRSGTEGAKVNQVWLSLMISEALLRVIRES